MDEDVAVSTNDGSSAPMEQRCVIWNHDMEGEDSLSTSVVFALAAAAEEDALDLDVPLSDVLDPDALDALFTPLVGDDADLAEVSFRYQGAEVTVRSNGLIEVEQA